jgi:predicted transcriptional regulator
MRSRRLNLEDEKDCEVYRALASDVRVHILDLLASGPMNINALGHALSLSAPTVTHHIQALEHAGLLVTEYAQGTQGTQKLCLGRYDRFLLSLDTPLPAEEQVEQVEIPVGLYTIAAPGGTCGLASPERIIGFYDDSQSFLLPERTSANILWMAEGYVEYVFPNRLPNSVVIDRMELSMEICSEAPEFDNDYPSDITVWVNGVEIGTWRSPGDLGGKRGRMFPSWWPARIAQYGLLKTWTVGPGGCYIDGERVSDVTLEGADVGPRKPVSLRIGVKPDAECVGGFNLLGRCIGNHDQDVVLKLFYSHAPAAG